MRSYVSFIVLTLTVALIANDAMAQRRGRGRNRQIGKVALLGVDKVAADLEINDDQKKKLSDLQEELRGQRGERGGRGNRQNFRDMSDEERTAFREEQAKQAAERRQLETDKLTQLLSADQLKRLDEIHLQVRGAAALLDSQVQANMGLSEETVKELTSKAEEANEERGQQMRELFQSGDRSTFREKMTELTQAYNDKVLGVLSDAEKEKFTAMQGEKLDVSMQDLFRGFGRGQRGNGGRPGRGGGRPNRQSRPEIE